MNSKNGARPPAHLNRGSLIPDPNMNGLYTQTRASPYATLERGNVSNTLGRMADHALAPTSYKLQSLATIATKYFIAANKDNSDDLAKDEEMSYLKAVERGDIDEVRDILTTYELPKNGPHSKDGSHSTINGNIPGISFIDESPKTSTENIANNNLKTESAFHDIRPDQRETSSLNNSMRLTVNQDRFNKKKKISFTPANTHKLRMLSATLPHTRSTSYVNPDNLKDEDLSVHVKRDPFNKNCRDQWGRSALFIAVSRKNLEMIELLLQWEVKIGECLYHAIDFGYYDVVELLIKYISDRNQVISGEDSFYTPGLTPIQLAAHKGDFIMLKILHNHGFRIMGNKGSKQRDPSTKQKDTRIGLLERTWDQVHNRLLFYQAMASPAYLIMMFTEGGFIEEDPQDFDFLERLFSLYGKLRKKAHKDMNARSVYLELAEQVEDFACKLLDELRSAEDLASILRFDPPGHKKKMTDRNTLIPVQRACDVHMKKFVAHKHCQLAVSCIRLGNVFDSGSGFKTTMKRLFLAFFFPILSFIFLVSPDSSVGRLMKNPMVNLSCHMMSEIVFVIIMVVRLFLLSYRNCDCLGLPPEGLEIVILLWVLGKAVNQVKRLRHETIMTTLTNAWKLNDLTTVLLFTVVICLRITDMVVNGPKSDATIDNCSYSDLVCDRSRWLSNDAAAWPLLISEACLAFLYLLVFIRAMELLYIDRTFGPLQLSLDKMLVDTFRFLTVFSISFIAFGCVMAQLYWAYGNPKVNRLQSTLNTTVTFQLCTGDEENAGVPTCSPVYSTIYFSLLQQFWTLFGYGYTTEPPQALGTQNEQEITHWTAMVASGIFHMWAVVVMLNMLIAMLSFSFERVRGNAELEWKFHRTTTWMKYIRIEVYPRPPPMNLIPSPRDLSSIFRHIKRLCTWCNQKRRTARRKALRPAVAANTEAGNENKRYHMAIRRVTDRYLKQHLLEEFQHDEDTHFLLQQQHQPTSRSASPSERNDDL